MYNENDKIDRIVHCLNAKRKSEEGWASSLENMLNTSSEPMTPIMKDMISELVPSMNKDVEMHSMEAITHFFIWALE